MMALRQIRGEKIPEETFQSEEKDLFELEENHLQNQFDEIEQNDEFVRRAARKTDERKVFLRFSKQNRNETFLLPEIEQIDDETVKDLPKEMQLDILVRRRNVSPRFRAKNRFFSVQKEIKEKLKRCQTKFEDLPKVEPRKRFFSQR